MLYIVVVDSGMTSGLFCTVLDCFGLCYIVVVDSGLTCGLIFGDLP